MSIVMRVECALLIISSATTTYCFLFTSPGDQDAYGSGDPVLNIMDAFARPQLTDSLQIRSRTQLRHHEIHENLLQAYGVLE